MIRRVEWSRDALDDIKRQIAFIAIDNPNAALRVADRIRDAGQALGEIATGSPGRMSGTFEKVVPKLPLIIAYSIRSTADGEVISIVRVIHAARDGQRDSGPGSASLQRSAFRPTSRSATASDASTG